MKDQLNSFIQGYIQALIFTECHADNPELEDKSCDDLAKETIDIINKDCKKFFNDNKKLIERVLSKSYPIEYAGRDFWLTRNRHGAGFWDRGLGEDGGSLTRAAHKFKECHAFLYDDGKIYLF